MKGILKISEFILLILIINSCKKDYSGQTDIVTDIDGNSYKTIGIGNQIWMAENLKVTHFQNGDYIVSIDNSTDWFSNYFNNLSNVARSYYNYDSASYADIYGAFYNFYAVIDSRKICPLGWHVPTDSEWTNLTDYLGGEGIAGDKMKETGSTHWVNPVSGSQANANNESKFTALPSGVQGFDGGFFGLGEVGGWWSSSEYTENNKYAWRRYVSSNLSVVSRLYTSNYTGLSVRCIRD